MHYADSTVNRAFVYSSRAFRKVLQQGEMTAQCDLWLKIRGESGVGKNHLARMIHDSSSRGNQPFVVWSVTHVPPSLALTALFGALRGSYTSADRDRPGMIEKAGKGTLLIDEIDKAPSDLQGALLQLLDENTYLRVGSTEPRLAECRLMFATSRDLALLVRKGLFLPDLYNRLQLLTIDIPPLRHRPEDIAPLVHHFAAKAAARFGRTAPPFSAQAMKLLEAHSWPGNAREVEGHVLNLVARSELKPEIGASEVEHVLRDSEQVESPEATEIERLRVLPEPERRSQAAISSALRLVDGCGVDAAKALGIPLRSFRRLQRKYGLMRRKAPGTDSGT